VGRITGRFLDWIVVVSGGLIVLGAVLVARAANEGLLENDLISPWHIPLYGGVFLAAYALLASSDRSRGPLWRTELPDGYAIAGFGLALFMVGVVADIGWGAVFGAGASVLSLFTPTHLLAVAGIGLVLVGPIRAPLRHGGRHLVDRLPAVIALGLVLGLAGWLTQYANPVTQVLARERTSAEILRDKGELWTMRPDGTRQTRLSRRDTQNLSTPAFSTDGTLVAAASWSYAKGGDPTQPSGVTSSIQVSDANATVSRTIAGRGGWLTTPVWSPDGRSLAVTINEQAPRRSTSSASVPTPPANEPRANEPPAPDQPGSSEGGWQWDVAIVPSDGSGKPRLLETRASTDVATDWSPDGRSLIGHSDRDGNFEVYRIDPSSGEFTNLTNNPSADTWASFSPDGKLIAFSSDRGGRSQVWIMDADGRNPHQLTTGDGENWLPAWSPGGNRLAFLSNRDGNAEIYAVDASGGTETNLTQTADANEWMTADAWAPDGSVIVYSSALQNADENQLSLPLAAAGIILQSILLAAILILASRMDRLPIGAITVILVVSTAILAAVSGEYEFVAAALVAGIMADLLAWQLRRSRPNLELRVLAFAAPALLMAAYLVALGLTGGLGWQLPVAISAIGLAGAAGLLMSYLAPAPAPATA